MLNKVQLNNLVIFMRRVTCTGEEALGWAETFMAVNQELAAIAAAEKAAAEKPAE